MYNINDIIPPADYQYRNGFSNEFLIEKLTDDQKIELENELIQMLADNQRKEIDTLITETLVYLKSKKAIPEMKRAADRCNNQVSRLSVLSSIFELTNDNNLVTPAIACFRKIEKQLLFRSYALIDAFYYLAKFGSEEINQIIEPYINNQDFLVSYNAKRSLGLIKD